MIEIVDAEGMLSYTSTVGKIEFSNSIYYVFISATQFFKIHDLKLQNGTKSVLLRIQSISSSASVLQSKSWTRVKVPKQISYCIKENLEPKPQPKVTNIMWL